MLKYFETLACEWIVTLKLFLDASTGDSQLSGTASRKWFAFTEGKQVKHYPNNQLLWRVLTSQQALSAANLYMREPPSLTYQKLMNHMLERLDQSREPLIKSIVRLSKQTISTAYAS